MMVFITIIFLFSFWAAFIIVFVILNRKREKSYDDKENLYLTDIKDNILLELRGLKSRQYNHNRGGTAITDLYLTKDALYIMARQSFWISYLTASPKTLTRKHLNRKPHVVRKFKMNSFGDTILLKFEDTILLSIPIELRIWGVTEEQKRLISLSLGGTDIEGLYMY